MPTADELKEIAATRSSIYRFFAGILNEPIKTPGHDFAEALLRQEPQFGGETACEEIREGLRLMEAFRAQADREDLEHEQYLLARERTRLFRGVKRGYGPRPPYEAVYGTYTSAQECFMSLLQAYHENEVSMLAESYERPDYLGTELDYLRYLSETEAQAWEADDRFRATARLRAEGQFLEDHLMVWAPRYLEVVSQETSHPCFQALALLLQGFLKEDKALVDQILAEVDLSDDVARAVGG